MNYLTVWRTNRYSYHEGAQEEHNIVRDMERSLIKKRYLTLETYPGIGLESYPTVYHLVIRNIR